VQLATVPGSSAATSAKRAMPEQKLIRGPRSLDWAEARSGNICLHQSAGHRTVHSAARRGFLPASLPGSCGAGWRPRVHLLPCVGAGGSIGRLPLGQPYISVPARRDRPTFPPSPVRPPFLKPARCWRTAL